MYNHDSISSDDGFFSSSPKGRRQREVIQKLAEMIGNNVKLYDMTLQFLRTLFLRTRNVHYCTLRAELLMALHDLEVQDIISVDPCHKFTWCLDACIREKNVDVKRSRELQGLSFHIPMKYQTCTKSGVFATVYCSIIFVDLISYDDFFWIRKIQRAALQNNCNSMRKFLCL